MRVFKLLILTCIYLFSTFTIAVAQQAKKPTLPRSTTWYIGVGPSVDAITVDYTNVNLKSALMDYSPAAFQSTAYNISPLIQLGFWKNTLSRAFLWGVKFLYKYLNASANYTFNTSLFLFNNQDAQVNHKLAALLLFGRNIRKYTPYVGVGVIWLPQLKSIYHLNTWRSLEDEDFLIGDDVVIKKSLLGGSVQLGCLYNLNKKWFIDVNYSVSSTGKTSLTKTVYAAGDPDRGFTERQTIRVMNQALMASINYRFIS